MQTYEKLSAVRKLVDIAESYSQLEVDIVTMIDKIVSPDWLRSATNLAASTKQPVSPTIDELFLARKHGKIAAIKAYRNRTGLGLKESKDNIEKALDYFGWQTNNGANNTYQEFLFEKAIEEPIPF